MQNDNKRQLPTSWNDITVSEWKHIDSIVKGNEDRIDREIMIASYFTGKSYEEIEEGDVSYFKEVMSKVSFVFDPIQNAQLNRRIKIDGNVYDACVELDKFKVNQAVDFTNLIKASDNVLSQCLADILPVIYLQGVYIPEQHAKHKEILQNAKVNEVIGAVFFYLELSAICERITKSCSQSVNEMIRKMMIEVASSKIGHGSIQSTNVLNQQG